MARMKKAKHGVGSGIGSLSRALRSERLAVLLTGTVFAGIAFVGTGLLPPIYRADTKIQVDAGPSDLSSPGAKTPADRVSLVASAEILADVSERFDLENRAEFQAPQSLLDRVAARIRPDAASSSGGPLDILRDRLRVYPIEDTRVLVIGFSSQDPILARDVPNAVAAEYLSRRKSDVPASGDDASDWLEAKIAGFREAVGQAEAKIADFRAKADLPADDASGAFAGRRLEEIGSELTRTRSARALAEDRAQSIRDAIEGGLFSQGVSDALGWPAVDTLRERRIALRAQITELSTTLLDGHPRLKSLRSQLRDLDDRIATETGRTQSALEAQADEARRREAALVLEMDELKAQAARTGGESVELRALEREAQSQRKLLESSLERYRSSIADGSRGGLRVDARILSEATLPAEPYFPKIVPITAAAGVGGLLLAVLAVTMKTVFAGRALATVASCRGRRAGDREAEPSSAIAATDDGPPTISAADLVEAVGMARISRVLLAGTPDANRESGVSLARLLAATGTSTILVDFCAGAEAARRMGSLEPIEDIVAIASSPTTFAHAIQRDRRSTAHSLAAVLGFDGSREDAILEAAATVLAALSQAYARSVVVTGSMSAADLAAMIDDNTAIVVPMERGGESAARAVLDRLAAVGLTEAVLMTAEETQERIAAA